MLIPGLGAGEDHELSAELTSLPRLPTPGLLMHLSDHVV